jgi:uncharacterized membrane protein (DUF485 family)
MAQSYRVHRNEKMSLFFFVPYVPFVLFAALAGGFVAREAIV